MEPFEFVILGALFGFLVLKAKPVAKATAKGYFAVQDKLKGTRDDFLAAIEEAKAERDLEFEEELNPKDGDSSEVSLRNEKQDVAAM